MSYLTTKETAKKLGITTGRVRQMVLAGQLHAEKFGRDLMIRESDLETVSERKAGRPKKTESENGQSNGGKKPKSFAEVAKKYIGCVDSGINDLGSNKKHLEGFGTKEAEKRKY
jgi:excisionase family DNA binding protein